MSTTSPPNPICWVKDYAHPSVHMVYIDPESQQSLIVQTAILHPPSAEIIGTFSHPDVPLDLKQRYWQQFQEELRARGITYVTGKARPILAAHYCQAYGMKPIAVEDDALVGSLMIVGKQLEAA